jgi:hypothetical protein
MDLQGIIVLIVAWAIMAVPAIYFIIRGSKFDCTPSEKKMTKYSAWGALVFATAVVFIVFFGVLFDWVG